MIEYPLHRKGVKVEENRLVNNIISWKLKCFGHTTHHTLHITHHISYIMHHSGFEIAVLRRLVDGKAGAGADQDYG